jgi:hypothetical protein
MRYAARRNRARLARPPALVLAVLLAIPLLGAPASGEQLPFGQFVIRCLYSHTLPDDPIVWPRQPGASHSHDFFGNTTVNAYSILETMLAGDTTCRVPSDTAGYWSPTVYLNGEPIRPPVMRIYYLGTPNVNVQSIPPGLQMIGGNMMAISPDENPNVSWFCGETKDVKTPRSNVPYDCTPWADQYSFVDGVIAVVDMPHCWSGKGLTPDTLRYPQLGGSCPAGLRIVLPRLSQRVHLGIMNPLNPDGSVAIELASGPYWTLHSDFWNTWQQDRLDQLVADCLRARVRCRAVDASGRVDWIRQFGTQRYDLAWASTMADDGLYVAGFTNFALEGQTYHRRYDAFIRKYDRRGNVVWTRQFGTSGKDEALAVAADHRGVTVVGYTDGRLPKQRALGGQDILVARFNADGRREWVRQFGTKRNDRATAVAIGGGGTYIAGSTGWKLGDRRAGGLDAFVARLNHGGELSWVRQFGTPGTDEIRGLSLRAGILHAVGWTTGSLAGPFVGGESDGFAVAFDTAGTRLWERQLGTDGADRVEAVVARAGGVFVAGSTGGMWPEQTPDGGLDAFVGKLDETGRPLWLRQFGSEADDVASALQAAGKGVYVAGSASGELPEGEHFGIWDGFVRKYLPNGTQMWTRQFGTERFDQVYGLAAERSAVYLVGTTGGAFEGAVNAGDRDVLVMRVAFS